MNTMIFLKEWANPGLFCCLFLSSQHVTIQIDKIFDGVLGIQTRGGWMEGPDESTKLLRHPTQ